MKTTEYTYEDIDAYVQSARVLRAHAIRDFFRALFAVAKPRATVAGQVQAA